MVDSKQKFSLEIISSLHEVDNCLHEMAKSSKVGKILSKYLKGMVNADRIVTCKTAVPVTFHW